MPKYLDFFLLFCPPRPSERSERLLLIIIIGNDCPLALWFQVRKQSWQNGDKGRKTIGVLRLLPLFFFFFFSFISLIADGPHHCHPACGHKGSSHLSPVHALHFFYRDASSALLQLVNQWLNFTYSRSHAFRYERKNTNPTLVRIELTTSYTINTLYVDYDAVAESGRNPNPNPILYSLCGL